MRATPFWCHPSTPVCAMQERDSQVLSSLLLHQPLYLLLVFSLRPSSLPQKQETQLPQHPSPGLVFRLGVVIRQGLDALLGHIGQHREGGLHDEVNEACREGGAGWRGLTWRAGQRTWPARLAPPAAWKMGSPTAEEFPNLGGGALE